MTIMDSTAGIQLTELFYYPFCDRTSLKYMCYTNVKNKSQPVGLHAACWIARFLMEGKSHFIDFIHVWMSSMEDKISPSYASK